MHVTACFKFQCYTALQAYGVYTFTLIVAGVYFTSLSTQLSRHTHMPVINQHWLVRLSVEQLVCLMCLTFCMEQCQCHSNHISCFCLDVKRIRIIDDSELPAVHIATRRSPDPRIIDNTLYSWPRSIETHPTVYGRFLLSQLPTCPVFKYESRAIAMKTARCRCKFRYLSKFTEASRGSPCDSTAFTLFARVYCDARRRH